MATIKSGMSRSALAAATGKAASFFWGKRRRESLTSITKAPGMLEMLEQRVYLSLSPTRVNETLVVAQSSQTILASFADPYNTSTSNYQVNIQWGDQTNDTGILVANGTPGGQNVYNVVGTHTYNFKGNYAANITITYNPNPSEVGSVESNVTVQPSNISPYFPYGIYPEGWRIPIIVSFPQTVTVSGGTPRIPLNTGGYATYSGGSGTNALTFTYTVQAGQQTPKGKVLDYTSASIQSNGACITLVDLITPSTSAADLTLPMVGTALPSESWITVDGTQLLSGSVDGANASLISGWAVDNHQAATAVPLGIVIANDNGTIISNISASALDVLRGTRDDLAPIVPTNAANYAYQFLGAIPPGTVNATVHVWGEELDSAGKLTGQYVYLNRFPPPNPPVLTNVANSYNSITGVSNFAPVASVSTASGTQVSGTAYDPDNPTQSIDVELIVNDGAYILHNATNAGNRQFSFDLSGLSLQTGTNTYSIKLQDTTAKNADGSSVYWQGPHGSLNLVAPQVVMTSPTSGLKVARKQTVVLTAHARVASGMNASSVAFYTCDGVLLHNGTLSSGSAEDGYWSYSWTTNIPGSYGIYAVVTDSENQIGISDTVQVTIMPPPAFVTTPPTDTIHINPYGAPPTVAPNVAWAPGDIFVAVGDNKILEYHPDGTLVRRLSFKQPSDQDMQFNDGMAFDSNGNLFETSYGQPASLDPPNGEARLAEFNGADASELSDVFNYPAGSTGTGVYAPNGVVFDAAGDMFVSDIGDRSGSGPNGGILEFDPNGSLIRHILPGVQVEWMDLESDQHTMLFSGQYGADGAIYSVDVSATDPTVNTFAHLGDEYGNLYGLRALPGPGVKLANGATAVCLVAGDSDIAALDSNGNVVAKYGMMSTPGWNFSGKGDESLHWFAVNLDPDGTSFWSATFGGDVVARFDIATGQVLQTIEPSQDDDAEPILNWGDGGPKGIFGLALYGEPTAAIPVGASFTYQAKATEDGQPDNLMRYSLTTLDPSGNNYGATINPITGLMSWSPTTDGNYTFTITATDPLWGNTTQSVPLTVDHSLGADHPPSIKTASLPDAKIGHYYWTQIQATDDDKDRLTYSTDTKGFTIDPNTGFLSWLPTGAGQVSVTVKVSDGRGGVDQGTFDINVPPPQPSTDLPFIDTTQKGDFDSMSLSTGDSLTYQVRAHEGDSFSSPRLHFVLTQAPDGMTIAPEDGYLHWTPNYNQTGKFSFTVGVTDQNDNYVERNFVINVAKASIANDGLQVKFTDAQCTTANVSVVVPFGFSVSDATYIWSPAGWPDGVPAPEIQPATPGGSSVNVVFHGAGGPYYFQIDATSRDGTTVRWSGLELPGGDNAVPAVASTLLITPKSLLVGRSQKFDLSATVEDQFGEIIDPPSPISWSMASSESGHVDSSGVYTAGSNEGNDVVQATMRSLSAQANVQVTDSGSLVGAYTSNLGTVEGQDTVFQGATGYAQDLAGFIDYHDYQGATPGPYTVVIDWGDNHTSNGTLVADTDLPAGFPSWCHMFSIVGEHTYSAVGDFAVKSTISAPGGRQLIIAPPIGTTNLEVHPADLSIDPVLCDMLTRSDFSGTVANFTDPVRAGAATDYAAVITWGDGTTSNGTITQTGASQYSVRAEHVYETPGTPTASIQIYEVHGANQTLREWSSLLFNVYDNSLTTPTNLRAVAVSTSQVQISWTLAQGAVGYKVTRTKSDNSTFTWYVANNNVTYDQYLDPHTSCSYTIVSVDQHGNTSSPSDPVSATTWTTAPAPSNVTVVPLSGTQIHLTWDDGRLLDPQISGWDILRATWTGTGTPPATAFASVLQGDDDIITAPSFYDTNLNSNTTYWYEVVAEKHNTERSLASTPVSVLTLKTMGVAIAATGLQVGYAGDSRVGLVWNAFATPDLLGFDIYRSKSANFVPSPETLIGSSDNNEYTDDNVPAVTSGTYYYYRVIAVYQNPDGGEIDASPTPAVSVDTNESIITPPAPPSNLQATVDSGQITLTWTDNSVDEAGFEISRRPSSGGSWELIDRVTQNAVTYTDTSIQPSTAYDYEVDSYRIVTANDQSLSALASAPVVKCDVGSAADTSPPNAPQNPAATASLTSQGDPEIVLTWSAPVDNGTSVTEYDIYRQSRDSLGRSIYEKIDTVPADASSYTDMPLLSNTTYDYEIIAVSSTANSYAQSLAASATATTLPLDNPKPFVEITSPAQYAPYSVDWSDPSSVPIDGRITSLTNVSIIVDDPKAGDLQSWSLVLRPYAVYAANSTDSSADILLTDSTVFGQIQVGSYASNLSQTVFGLDPSRYPTGQYMLILTATGETGSDTTGADVIPVSLASNVKLGGLTLPVTDFSLDVPGGQPITIARTYDSQNASTLEDLGYGWQLQLSNSTISTTGVTTGELGASTGTSFGGILRVGDFVYITTPDGQQYTFQFLPVPDSYKPDPTTHVGVNPYDRDWASSTYSIQFVSVDGSGATLRVPGDISYPLYERYHFSLSQDPSNPAQQLLVLSGTPGDEDFNNNTYYDPSNPEFGGTYQLTTMDGTQYALNSTSGQLNSITDPNGNVSTYSGASGMTSGAYSLSVARKLDADQKNGTVVVQVLLSGTEIATITYTLSSGQLMSVATTHGNSANLTTTGYLYTSKTGHNNLLTTVINSQNIQVLNATYNDFGFLTSLVDAGNNTTSIPAGGLTGNSASQGASNGQTDTDSIYDANGDVTRQITAVKDANGTLQGWSVTVTLYNYSNASIVSDISNIFLSRGDGQNTTPGVASVNTLVSVQQYQPFFVPVANPDARYTQQPTTIPLHEIDYKQPQSGSSEHDPDLYQPKSERFYLSTDASGKASYRVVSYSGYVLGKPKNVTQSIEIDNGGNPTVVSTATPSAKYDSSGNALQSTDANGVTTYYDYTNETTAPGLPVGLLLDSYTIPAGTNSPCWQTVNKYFNDDSVAGDPYLNDQNSGKLFGRLASTTTYSASNLSQTTYYAYDSMGNVVATFIPRSWTNNNGIQFTGWQITITKHDYLGRSTDTLEYTYIVNDSSLLSDPWDNASMPNGFQDNSWDWSTLGFNRSYKFYNDQSQQSDSQVVSTVLHTSNTTYTSDGKTATSTDQYGAVTQYIYDARGELIDTLHPNGIEVRSVYDSSGRVIWQTDRYSTGATAIPNPNVVSGPDNTDTAMTTHTIYDSQGRVASTQRYNGILIKLVQDSSYSGVWQSQVDSTTTVSSNVVSTSSTVYNDAGQAVETIDATGLRTGTIYYPDGSIQYSGPLDPTAPTSSATTPWYKSVNPTLWFLANTSTTPSVREFSTYYYNQIDTANGNLLYDSTKDAYGHVTKTYHPYWVDTNGNPLTAPKDAKGNIVAKAVVKKTVYDDGSFTETFTSINGQLIPASAIQVSGSAAISNPTATEGWPGSIQPGGSEKISIAQMKADVGDQIRATYSFYNVGGELTDVFQPAVPDPNSGNSLVHPHTQYTYDAAGNELSQKDANKHLTTFTYDAMGRQMSRSLPAIPYNAATASPTAHELPDGTYMPTEYSVYDQYGRLYRHTDFDGNVANYSYYATGETILSITDGTSQYEMIWTNDASTATGFSNSSGWVGSVGGVGVAWIQTGTSGEFELVYANGLGQSLNVTFAQSDSNFIAEMTSALHTEGFIGATATMVEISQPAGAPKQVYYSAAAGSSKTEQVVGYSYDALGRQLAVYDTVNGVTGVTHNQYDVAGNLITQITPEGTVLYTFDPATGQHTDTYTYTDSTRTAYSTHTTYHYNTQGQLDQTTVSKLNGQTVNIVTTDKYDALGNKYQEVSNGITTTYSYDHLNRLTDVVEKNGSAQIFKQHYTLNSDGTRSTSTEIELQPDGSTQTINTSWQYDGLGRLTDEAATNTYSTGLMPANDLPTSITLPANSDYSQFSSDEGASDITLNWDGTEYATAQLPAAWSQSGAMLVSPIAGVAYGGNGSDWVLVTVNDYGETWSWTMTLYNGTFIPDGVNESSSTDQAITGPLDAGDYSDHYSYDLASNRHEKRHAGPGGGQSDITDYQYNANDEVVSQFSSSSGWTTFTYDDNGSLIKQISEQPQYKVGLDTTFGIGGTTAILNDSAWITAEAVLPNGDILAVGSVDSTVLRVEFKPDGSIDPAFGAYVYGVNGLGMNYNGTLHANALAVAADGTFFVTGCASDSSGSHIFIAKFRSDGTMFTSFGTSGNGIVILSGVSQAMGDAISLLPNGDILVAGTTFQSDGVLAEFRANGTLDPTFSGGVVTITSRNTSAGASGWNALSVLPNGNILVSGGGRLAEYSSIGQPVPGYGSNGIALTSYFSVYGMTVLADGEVLLLEGSPFNSSTLAVEKFYANGTREAAFGTSGGLALVPWNADGTGANALLSLPSGEILVAGSGTDSSGYQDLLLAEFKADGTLDSEFGSAGVVLTPLNTWTQATAITLLADGEVLVTGQINAYYRQAGFLAKYHVSGSPESYDNSSTQEIDYTYDVRNKLIEVSDNGSVEAAYLYNDSGDRVAETVGGVTTLYLTDTQNPTGYDKPIEERNSATGKPIMTFILGDRVLGQVDAAGNVTYLLSDGHGSTRVLVTAAGTVVAAFNYDAFGTALNFNPGMAATAFLFGGDAFYDAPSGLFFHGDGTRERLGFVFIEQDFGQSGQGNPSDPISLHKYLYANGDPVNGRDPSGHFDLADITTATAISSVLVAISVPVLSGYSSYRAGNGFWHGAWRGTPAGAAMGVLVLEDRGLTSPKFYADLANILYATTWGMAYDALGAWSRNPQNFTFTAKFADDSFWNNFSTFSQGKAFGKLFGGDSPLQAAIANGAFSALKDSPTVATDLIGNIQNAIAGKPNDWEKTGHDTVNMITDGFLAFYKTLVNEGVANDLPEPIKTTLKAFLWGGVNSLLKALKG